MRRVRIRSWKDYEALPEDEWVEIVGGIRFRIVHATALRISSGRVVVEVPKYLVRDLRLKPGEKLSGRVERGRLIISRRAGRAASRRRRAN